MPRTDLNEILNELVAERKLDSDHIGEHIKASQESIVQLKELATAVEAMIRLEGRRLESLQAHQQDINTTKPNGGKA